jgi:hypothetical protein
MLINLISGPRNISTALMYSFAQHPDITVLDEPFYAYYLSKHAVDHPGKNEVIGNLPDDWRGVEEMIDQTARKAKPILFLKNMAHHLTGNWQGLLDRSVNAFLIRNPRQLIASFAQVIECPTLQDIALKKQFELFQYLQAKGMQPPVLDSGELLKDPPGVLSNFCKCLGLPFDKAMLSWPQGPKEYDGSWAPYWYSTVHQTSGFSPQKSSTRPLPGHLTDLYQQALPFYEALFEKAIKA